MAETKKERGTQLIRTDESVPGRVGFYDRRVEDAKLAYIGQVDVDAMLVAAGVSADLLPKLAAVRKLACHGAKQNILDSSNSLEGDARRDYVRKSAAIVQNGGWASVPVDAATMVKNAVEALVKLNVPREQAEKLVAAQMKKSAA